MKFSVIVPIYNVDNFLRECIESVLNQTYTNFELILVDDGSRDNSNLICDEYAQKDQRIIVIHKSNGGLVSARKAGVEIASGDYAICVDGDDFLHIDCLQTVHYILSQKTDVDVVCFGFNLFRENITIPKPINCDNYGYYDFCKIKQYIYPILLYSRVSRGFPHQICGKAIRLGLYKKYQQNVPSRISMGEDAACMHPLLSNISSLYIEEKCLYYYRQVMTSMSKVRKPLSWDNYDIIFNLYEKEIDFGKSDFRQQYYRLRTHNLFNITMSQFYSGKPYKQVINDIKERFKNHPEYDVAINNSDFLSLPLRIVRCLLKYRCFWIIEMYANNKNIFKRFR